MPFELLSAHLAPVDRWNGIPVIEARFDDYEGTWTYTIYPQENGDSFEIATTTGTAQEQLHFVDNMLSDMLLVAYGAAIAARDGSERTNVSVYLDLGEKLNKE